MLDKYASLVPSLCQFADAMDHLSHDDWWVLGSAALALPGGDVGEVRDIDVLVSYEDAHRLARAWQKKCLSDGGTPHYRSTIFFQHTFNGLPVDVMAGYEIKSEAGWEPVRLKTRKAVKLDSQTLFIPDLQEQAELLFRLGRSKDYARLKSLDQLISQQAQEQS